MKRVQLQVAAAIVIALTALAPAGALAKSESEIRQAIEQALVERHPNDSPQWWRSLGPKAPRVIIAMYEGSDEIYHRLRLIGALAHFPDDPRAVELLKRTAENTGDDLIQQTAIRGIGISQGERELEFVSKYLSHPDPQTRLAAAESLQEMGGTRASARLQEYLGKEKAPFIAQKLRKERPPALHPLRPVASSEDAPSPELDGLWRGVLVFPTQEPGMATRTLALSLRVERGAPVTGELRVAPREGTGKERRVRLEELKAAGAKLSGKLAISQVDPALASRSPVEFSGELVQRAGEKLIRLELPSHAASVVVRKQRQ